MLPFGFVIVSVSVAVPDVVIELGENAAAMVGAAALTVSCVAVVAVPPVTALGPVADTTPVV